MTAPLPRITSDYAYRRPDPQIDRTVAFRRVALDRDLDRLHAWLTSDHVTPYWDLGAPLPAFRQAIGDHLEDDHVTAYVGCIDGVPMSYVERYWAAADPLADHYDADDNDQGIHILIGPPEYLGQGCGTALLRAMTALAFRHAATDRVVAEPDATNDAAIAAFERAGFEPRETFRFPHEDKDATRVVCDRERFVGAFSPGAIAANGPPADGPAVNHDDATHRCPSGEHGDSTPEADR
ncbi:GNAT family N-acetyltransferase [Halobacterium salinarum]|uniref:GNAT family N-acetyltransferase n=1 Tax=Halobacterium salinarum TaxID=2242 RepID=UPI001F272F8D|nr:GNAT family N-acetyltransferase [Halobacterium salinarum]MCF2164908.1 acetyltransferase [Halobacterium salinarum]MCF2168998.1 acetyltransferase [Halobacterium salinarum]MCF2237722.1 acetyltransferase [Halobacterium salinarum]WJK64906.1 GNAT family N-acetyltransferase [Halobacterium salinarum]